MVSPWFYVHRRHIEPIDLNAFKELKQTAITHLYHLIFTGNPATIKVTSSAFEAIN